MSGLLDEMDVPSAVKNEARQLIKEDGCNFRLLGNYKGREAYLYCFPEGTLTGYPFVFLYDKVADTAIQVNDNKALEIANELAR